MAEVLTWPRRLDGERRGLALRRLYVFGGVCFCVFLAYGAYRFFGYLGAYGLAGVALIAVAALGLAAVAVLTGDDPREKRYARGSAGEWAVARELAKLPDGWYVLNDLVVNGAQVDHVVLGPGGLFCIETKNWRSAAVDADGNWRRFDRGRWVPGASPAKQNLAHIAAVKNVLRERFGGVRFESLVVLAHPAGQHFVQSVVVPPGGTRVLWLPQLVPYLLNGVGSGVPPERLAEMARHLASADGALPPARIFAPGSALV